MRALAHPDLFVLEATLGDLVRRAQADDLLARVAVIVPTERLAAHLRRRLAARCGALLGVEVLHHRALIYRILDAAGRAAPRVLSDHLQVELLRAALPESGGDELGRFVAGSPGALPALLGTLTDLREAGVAPDEARAALGAAPRGREIAALYERYVTRLGRAEAAGLTDGAGLARAALPHAAAFAARHAALIHHGAYDLIGVHLEILRALDAARELTVLLPALLPVPGWPDAAGITPENAADAARAPEWPPRRGLLADRLAHLHDERWEGDPLPADAFRCAHAQGNSAELHFALHAALARVGAGTPPAEVGIVARHLAPWSVLLPAAADGFDLRVETSLALPADRSPIVRELLLLLRTIADGFERGPTVELLASPRIRWDRLPEGTSRAPSPDPAIADRASRAAGLIGGLSEWTEALGAETRGNLPAAALARIRSALAALEARVQPARSRPWSGHADAFASLAAEVLAAEVLDAGTEERAAPQDDGVLDRLLGEMRLLPAITGEKEPIPFARAVAWLEESAAATPLPLAEEDRGGLRVLDAMQARGLTFDTLVLIGMNDGLMPRPAREDPLLPDDLRRALREATGRPVPIKSAAEDEERLLLGMLLGSAGRRLEVTWQRADDAGRERAPSLALRAVGRLGTGRADLDAVRRSAVRVAAHPAQRLEETAVTTGLLAPREAVLLAALRGGPAALVGQRTDLAAGLMLLRATEGFAPGDLSFDGRVAPLPDATPLGVSTLQAAGGCALQAFFRYRLRLRESIEEAEAETIPPRDLGMLVHAVLQQLYERLFGAGEAIPQAASEQRLRRAEALLDEIWDAQVRTRFSPRARRLPALWRHELGRWHQATREFVRRDLARLAERGAFDLQVEQDATATIDLPGSRPLRLRGRFDRRITGPEGDWIADYKTSRGTDPLERMMDPTAMLRGLALQAPLYHLMAGESATGRQATVEFLLVRPAGADAEDDEESDVAIFPGFSTAAHRDGFLETLRVIADLLRDGRHPLRPDEERCARCAWRTACRRRHPPTLQREATAADAADYRALARKNKSKKTHLRDLGGPDAAERGEEEVG